MSFGMPDQGFMGLADIADHTWRIRDAVSLPLIVDADTGFGNALNVRHTVRTLERAGADSSSSKTRLRPSAAATSRARKSFPPRKPWARSRRPWMRAATRSC